MMHRVLVLYLLMQLSPLALSKSSTAMEQVVYMVEMQGSPRTIETKHVHTLASVLGSETAARKAILYHYTKSTNGFASILTEQQVKALSKQLGVLVILPSLAYPIPPDPYMSSP